MAKRSLEEKPFAPWRERLHEIIFEADTPMGRIVDITLLILIILSVIVVMLESVDKIGIPYHNFFYGLEWFFTIIFTIEYVLRIISVHIKRKYMFSFFGIVDLLAILPTYLSLFVPGSQYLTVVRALRILRIFRILKLAQYLNESRIIVTALRNSLPKITVFLLFVILLVTIFGSIMYLVEGGEGSKFTSIPESIYWAIVTLTTVGYGDISPVTAIGQFLAAVVMILGYAVIAVPTGIVTGELLNPTKEEEEITTQVCRYCSREGHDSDAEYCKYCGEILNVPDDWDTIYKEKKENGDNGNGEK